MLDLKVSRKYSSENNNIIEEFYLPVLSSSKSYRRAVGYFTSGILVAYIKSIKNLYLNNGNMKLIISPIVASEDLFAIAKYNEIEPELDEQLRSNFYQKLESMLNSNNQEEMISAELFFILIVSGLLEVKIATPKKGTGIFHEKIGIFDLIDGEKIAIIGSNNETFNSVSNNHESFNTFCTWEIGQKEYVNDHEETFETYWNNMSKNLNIHDIDEALVKKLFKNIPKNQDLDSRFNELMKINIDNSESKLDFAPYDYQKKASELLLESKSGILEYATGSGKTKLAIYFMEELKKSKSKTFFVIVVPDKTLMEQWYDELNQYNMNILKCYSETIGWASSFRDMIDIYNQNIPNSQVVLVTNQSMFRGGIKSKFLRNLDRLKKDYILIVDELHNWSTKNRANHLPEADYKVGLSATPFNTPLTESDKKIDAHFGGIIASYSLEQAISDGKLVPYNYYPVFVNLTDEESLQYKELSRKIVQLRSILELNFSQEISKSLEMLRFKRSRVVYGAINKIDKLQDKIIDNEIAVDSLLIYCGATSYNEDSLAEADIEKGSLDEDSISQLQLVNKVLNDMGIKNVQYTQKETTEERAKIIELFSNKTYSTMVAIKCLDEGVDIPSIKNAVILASSSNKRELIQRRGRILRRDGTKEYANLFDFIVIDNEDINSHLNKIERTRFAEFASLAINNLEIKNRYHEYLEGEIYGDESEQ